MVEYVGEKTRHHCLNPKCRCKLANPVSNARSLLLPRPTASRGSFYRFWFTF